MGKTRGGKPSHSRAGHKGKNKKTYRGAFHPIMNPWEIKKYIDIPKRKDTTNWKTNVKDLFRDDS
jgi:hypothetical protein